MERSEKTIKAGVIGWPIEHSLSPRLHGYWLRKHGIKGVYNAMPVEPGGLEKALRNLTSHDICGVNVTVPYKEDALVVVDAIDPLAKRIGAINIVLVTKEGKLEGRNTDAYGFSQNLVTSGFEPKDKVATLLGAGGAARAATVALLDMGVKSIRIMNRTKEKGEILAKEFSTPSQTITSVTWNDPSALENINLLANATSLGLKGQPPLELSLEKLPKDAFVTDAVYAPLMTDLLIRALKHGNKVVDGLGMLLHQAKPAFKAFYGVEPEVTDELRAYVLDGRP